MNLALLSSAIETRATSDTGSGGLFETGAQLVNHICFDTPIAGQTPPLIIVSFPGSDEDDTFGSDANFVDIEFELVIQRRFGTFSTDSTILQRIHALYHRWAPTTGTYSTQRLRRVTGTTAHDEEFRRYIERYSTRMDRNTSGPV